MIRIKGGEKHIVLHQLRAARWPDIILRRTIDDLLRELGPVPDEAIVSIRVEFKEQP